MSDPSFQAFRLLARKHDREAPDGERQVVWLAIMKSARHAEAAVREKIGDSWDVVLAGGGTAVMEEARKRGLKDGDALKL